MNGNDHAPPAHACFEFGRWLQWLLLWPIIRVLLGRLPRRRRVPVLLQMNQAECGAACLAMVLGYFGRAVRITDCREACDTGRDGVNAQTLAQAARAHGLRVKAYSLEPAHFRFVPLPAIVHWNFNHFVVVERWSPRRVTIVDPAAGRRRLTAAEFDTGLTGVVLTLEPGAHFERGRTVARRPWRTYLASILKIPGARGLLLQVLGASLLLQVLGLALPVFTVLLVDRILPFRIPPSYPSSAPAWASSSSPSL